MLSFQFIFYWIQRFRGRLADPVVLNNTGQQGQGDSDDENWNIDLQSAFEISLNIGVIAFVEMTIKWNNITGVHTLRDPGQFMPLMIALAQLFSVIYQGVSKFAHIAAVEDDAYFEGKFLPSSFSRRFVFNVRGNY